MTIFDERAHRAAAIVAEQSLANRIEAACTTTEPFTAARKKALATVKWVLQDQHGNYIAKTTGIRTEMTSDVNDAMVYDGRDNEEFKIEFFNAVTGLTFSVVLI